jgi:ankyrin repeat protein
MDGTGEAQRTPLMEAAHRGCVQIIELLLARGAAINARGKHYHCATLCPAEKGL